MSVCGCIYSVCDVCLWLQYWGQLKDKYEDDDNIGEGSGVKDACTDTLGVFAKDLKLLLAFMILLGT